MRIGMILDNEIDDDIRVQNEINVLTHSNHEIVLLCKGKGSRPKFEKRENLIIHRVFIPKKVAGALMILSQRIPLFQYFWYYQLNKMVKGLNIDAIHAHDMYMFTPAKKVAKKLKKPLILDLHENYPETVKSYEWTKKWYAKIFYNVDDWTRKEEYILSTSDKLIVLSDLYKTELINRYASLKADNIIRYANVPDLALFDAFKIDPSIINKANSFVIFYFGVIARRRGIYTLLEAVKKVSMNNDNVKLLLIGPVDNAEKKVFKEFVEELDLGERLIYFPWKDISLLPSYINISDVCVSPLVKNDQHESGVANKIFQYMYFKRPLIVSNCKPQADIVIENKCGVVFESENVDQLTEKISYFIKTPELIEELGENGYRAIVEDFNSKNEGENLVALYKSIANKESVTSK